MADQEFLASFGVEIDETGLDRLQKALKQNRALADELAAASARAASAASPSRRRPQPAAVSTLRPRRRSRRTGTRNT